MARVSIQYQCGESLTIQTVLTLVRLTLVPQAPKRDNNTAWQKQRKIRTKGIS
jgi:hypothetical protein